MNQSRLLFIHIINNTFQAYNTSGKKLLIFFAKKILKNQRDQLLTNSSIDLKGKFHREMLACCKKRSVIRSTWIWVAPPEALC